MRCCRAVFRAEELGSAFVHVENDRHSEELAGGGGEYKEVGQGVDLYNIVAASGQARGEYKESEEEKGTILIGIVEKRAPVVLNRQPPNIDAIDDLNNRLTLVPQGQDIDFMPG